MKTFKDYLTESKKTYKFKIGVAGEIPEHFEGHLRMALEKYSLANLSAGKKTPIQKRPLDFPNIENSEVTYWDAEINYPTNEAILKNYLGQVCSVHESQIVVHNPDAPINAEQEAHTEKSDTYETLLTKEDMGGESGQNSVGNARVMDLLKELETARKERGDSKDFKMETPKEEPQNNESAIGS